MYEIAKNHAQTTSTTLVRSDFSSFHTYLMQPETGEAVEGKQHQGLRDESTWARGQAWVVYGFALSYRYTQENWFLEVARKAANVFIANLPVDNICYWDFSFNDRIPDIRDTSAAAIFACGLLEICPFVEAEEKNLYMDVFNRIMKSLYQNYSTRDIPHATGLLREGMYHREDFYKQSVSWGDYFYFEALARVAYGVETFW